MAQKDQEVQRLPPCGGREPPGLERHGAAAAACSVMQGNPRTRRRRLLRQRALARLRVGKACATVGVQTEWNHDEAAEVDGCGIPEVPCVDAEDATNPFLECEVEDEGSCYPTISNLPQSLRGPPQARRTRSVDYSPSGAVLAFQNREVVEQIESLNRLLATSARGQEDFDKQQKGADSMLDGKEVDEACTNWGLEFWNYVQSVRTHHWRPDPLQRLPLHSGKMVASQMVCDTVEYTADTPAGCHFQLTELLAAIRGLGPGAHEVERVSQALHVSMRSDVDERTMQAALERLKCKGYIHYDNGKIMVKGEG